MALQKITPFLWFDTQAADAAAFYVTIFPNSEVSSSNPLITTFVLDGLQIIAMKTKNEHLLRLTVAGIAFGMMATG